MSSVKVFHCRGRRGVKCLGMITLSFYFPARGISMIKSSWEIISWMILLIIPAQTDPRPAQTDSADTLWAVCVLKRHQQEHVVERGSQPQEHLLNRCIEALFLSPFKQHLNPGLILLVNFKAAEINIFMDLIMRCKMRSCTHKCQTTRESESAASQSFTLTFISVLICVFSYGGPVSSVHSDLKNTHTNRKKTNKFRNLNLSHCRQNWEGKTDYYDVVSIIIKLMVFSEVLLVCPFAWCLLYVELSGPP